MRLEDRVPYTRENLLMLKEIVEEIQSVSFKSLLKYQEDILNIEVIQITQSDIFYDRDGGFVKIGFPEEMIAPPNRQEYYRAIYYNRFMDISEVMQNTKLFKRIPLVFINGELTLSYRLFMKDSYTELKFDTILNSNPEYPKVLSQEFFRSIQDGNITILMMPTQKMSYTTNGRYDEILRARERGDGLNRTYFQSMHDINPRALLFIETSHTGRMTSIPIEYYHMSNSLNMFKGSIHDKFYDDFHPVSDSGKLLYYGSYNLSWIIKGRASEIKGFRVPVIGTTPISPRNMIVFYKDGAVYKYDHNKTNIILSRLPNVYTVEFPQEIMDKEIVIYTFREHTPPGDREFIDVIKLYRLIHGGVTNLEILNNDDYNNDPLISYYDNTDGKKFFNYDVVLSNTDYLSKSYATANSDEGLYKYYTEKFKEIIDKDMDLYSIYQSHYLRNYYGTYVYVKDIKNLEDQYRTDTSRELGSDNLITFKERHLYLKIEKGYTPFGLEIFVDGYYLHDYVIETPDFFAVYIPESKIDIKNTIIEINRVYIESEREVPYNPKNNIHTVNLLSHFRPLDIYVYNKSTDTVDEDRDGRYLLIDKGYNISDTRGNLGKLQYEQYYSTVGLKSTKNFSNYFVKPVRNYKRMDIVNPDNTYVVNEVLPPLKTHREMYRVYRGGRLVHNVNIAPTYNSDGSTTLKVKIDRHDENQDITLVQSHQLLHQVCYIDDMNTTDLGQRGYIDFQDHGGIPFPFDFKFYDLYVNGVKMTPRDIKILSPTKIVLKKGVGNNIRVRLYLRDLFIGVESTNNAEYPKMIRLDDLYANSKLRDSLENYIRRTFDILAIIDSITDTDDVDEHNIKNLIKWMRLNIRMINPDLNNLDIDTIRTISPDVLDGNNNLLIFPDKYKYGDYIKPE